MALLIKRRMLSVNLIIRLSDAREASPKIQSESYDSITLQRGAVQRNDK